MKKIVESDVVALARLDETPDDIVAKRRAELEGELRALQAKKRAWIGRAIGWRRGMMLDRFGSVDDLRWFSIFSFLFRSAQCVLLYIVIFRCEVYSTDWWLSISPLILLSGGMGIYLCKSDEEDEYWPLHLLHYLVLPLMPILRFFDLAISFMPASWCVRWSHVSMQIGTKERELADLSVIDVVTGHYTDGIRAARKSLLGEKSELREVEYSVSERLEKLRPSRLRLEVRIREAAGDEIRSEALNAALQNLVRREETLVKAQTDVQKTITATTAILDECAARVQNLRAPLQDVQLIREIEVGEIEDQAIIEAANIAVERHVELIRTRLMELTVAVTVAPSQLLSTGADADIDAEFENIERMAERVTALES